VTTSSPSTAPSPAAASQPPAPGTRPFRFGAKGTRAASAREWTELARAAEDLGYATFQVPDHLGDQLACVPAIMAAASVTTSLQVGPLVAGVDFRNPVMFAKEAATIDLLSDGRFVMGIGAGWSDEDYAFGGLRQDSAGVRLDRMAEAVQVMRAYWGGSPFSFHGEHYSVTDVVPTPTPASPIPVLIGGGGQKALTLAAQQADIVSINPKVIGRKFDARSLGTAVASLVDERLDWIKQAAGRRFDSLELQMHVFVAIVTDNARSVAADVAARMGLPEEILLAGPYFQIGSVESITENMLEMRERWGISYVAFQQQATREMAPVVERLAGR
jgi:probable F420-dependent oxidoreductase